MGSRIDKTMRGILIPDSRVVNADNLADNDAAASNSDYTQGGSRPGSALTTDAFARLVPQLSGEQGVNDALITVMSGGNPGKDEGAVHVVVRTSATGEADSDYRGWNHPVFINGWNSITDGASNPQVVDVACIPSTQTPVVIYTENTAILGDIKARTFDFSATPPDWGAEVDISFDGGGAASGVVSAVALMVIPETERLVAFIWGERRRRVDAYFSDDAGATWGGYTLGATAEGDPFGATNDADRMRVAIHRGDVVIFLEDEGASGDLAQYASNNLGTRFTKVEVRSAFGHQVSTFSMPDGSGIGLVYRAQATNYPSFVRVGSAYQPTSDATAVVIDDITVGHLTAYVDWDGKIYVFGRSTVAGFEDNVICWFSDDNGDTFQIYTIDPLIGAADGDNIYYTNGDDAVTVLQPGASCAARGYGLVVADSTQSPGTGDDDLHGIWSGGWSDVVASHGEVTAGGFLVFPDLMMGWGTDPTSRGRTWLPIELPSDLADWNLVSTAGTLGEFGMTITTAAGFGSYTRVPGSTTPDRISLMFEVEVTSAGDTALTTGRVGMRVRLSDGTNDLDVEIRCDGTGFRVYDNNAAAAVGSDQAVTGTFQVMLRLDTQAVGSGKLWVWWRLPFETTWTAVTENTNVTNDTATPTANSLLQFGNMISGTATSRWKQFHYKQQNSVAGYTQRLESVGADNVGKSLNGLPYPLPDLGTSAGEAFISARSGPGRNGSLFTIAPTYDHPVEAMLPGIEPSPKTTWRSTSTAEQRFSFDLTDNTFLGSYSIGLYLDGINFRKATLEGWNGSSWTTLGTFDGTAGFTTVSYVLAGDILSPNTSSGNDGSRFVQTNEFVGGHVLLGTEGAADPREILQNSGGVWTSNDTVLPKFRLDGIDGGEAASGAGETNFRLCAPRGLLVVHLADDQQYSKFQVTIPASQDTPTSTKTGGTSGGGDWYECGVMMLGYLGILGKQHSRAWQQRLVPNVETTSVQGTIRTREISEMIEEWTWSWVNTADMRKIRNSTDLDFYASSEASKAALVADQDVFWALKGYMRDAKSGEYPVVAMSAVTVTSGTTITDPSLILYGSLTSAIQGTHVVGDEASGEVYRIEPITVRGIK